MNRQPCTACGGFHQTPVYLVLRCDHCNGIGFEPNPVLSPVTLSRPGNVSLCASCGESQTINIERDASRPFSRTVRTWCGCGYFVEVKAFLDPDKVCSRDPLPGYDRMSMIARLSSLELMA